MRRIWAAGAAVVLCLALGGLPALAQEASPTAGTSSPEAPPVDGAGSGSLTVVVAALAGMEGLELAGGLSPMEGPGVPSTGFFETAMPIVSSPFTMTPQTIALPSGAYTLDVFAGQPPCVYGWAPVCGGGTEFACALTFEIRPDEDLRIVISGLPDDTWPGRAPCPVSAVLHSLCAPSPGIDFSLVPGADGFVFEEISSGVRRLVTDGAGHYPSATDICEARDMDSLAVDEQGRVLVWSTTHGIDNLLAGDSQLWVLGVEGFLDPSDVADAEASGWPGSDYLAPDGSTWSLGGDFRGLIRVDGETGEQFLPGNSVHDVAITPDGRVWVAVGHDDGEAGGIYVVEPDAHGDPLEIPAS